MKNLESQVQETESQVRDNGAEAQPYQSNAIAERIDKLNDGTKAEYNKHGAYLMPVAPRDIAEAYNRINKILAKISK